MELRLRKIRGARGFANQIELIIEADNTTITSDLIDWNSDSVDEKFIENLEDVLSALKQHNAEVEEYIKIIKNEK